MYKKMKLILILLLLTGCKPNDDQQVLIESSQSQRPAWVLKTPEPDMDTLQFVGLHQSDSLEGRRDAFFKALANATQYVQLTIDSNYESTTLISKNDTTQQLKTDIIKASASAIASGAKETDSYWEKWIDLSKTPAQLYYINYVLIQIPKAELKQNLQTQLQALSGSTDTQRNWDKQFYDLMFPN